VTRAFPRFGRCGRDFAGIKTHDDKNVETAETEARLGLTGRARAASETDDRAIATTDV